MGTAARVARDVLLSMFSSPVFARPAHSSAQSNNFVSVRTSQHTCSAKYVSANMGSCRTARTKTTRAAQSDWFHRPRHCHARYSDWWRACECQFCRTRAARYGSRNQPAAIQTAPSCVPHAGVAADGIPNGRNITTTLFGLRARRCHQGTIIEVACWAHAHRKFFEARTAQPRKAHAILEWNPTAVGDRRPHGGNVGGTG